MKFGINRDDRLNLVRPFAMLDLETLGTKVDSPIIEIGICHYKNGRYISNSEFVKPNWSKADPDTLKWWEKQPYWPDLKSNVERYGLDSVDEAIASLLDKFQICGIMLIDDLLKYYALGPQFDMSMLDKQSSDVPWHFRNVRDLRTTFDDLNNGDRPKVEMHHDIPHSAQYDAERQAKQLVYIQQTTNLQTTMNLVG